MFGALSVLSEGLVLLTLGLVKPWGRRAVAEPAGRVEDGSEAAG